MKTNIAIVGVNGHFHNEIDFPGSEGLEGMHEYIQLQRTFLSSPSAMVLLCRPRTHRICFILVSKVVTSGFFWGVDIRIFVFVFPSVYVDLGSRGCSWLASPDEFRLCILLVLVRRRHTSFRIFSGTSSLGTFRILLTFNASVLAAVHAATVGT